MPAALARVAVCVMYRQDDAGRAAPSPSVVASPTEAGPPPASSRDGRARLVAMFAVVSTALLMSTLDATIVATALDDVRSGLHTSVTWAGWTITAYSLGLVLALAVAGKLTGRYGARRVFVASVAIFTVASLCCGLVDDIYLLIGLRFLQAVGGAGFTPSATSIVVTHFGAARDKAVGLFGSMFTTGAMLGPVLGGVIVGYFSWRGVFLVNVPIGAALLALCLRVIPRDPARTRHTPVRLDPPGVALLGSGLLAGMVGLAFLGDTPPGWVWPCAGCLAVSALALGAFFRHVAHAASPLIPPRLIHGRGFAAVNLVNVVFGGAGSGLVALIPLYAATRFGIDALGAGLLLAAEGAGAIAASFVGAFALRRTGYRVPLYSAALLVAAGMVALAWPAGGVAPSAWLAGAAGLVGIGLGWSSPASRNAGLQLVPDQAAPLAALRSTAMQVGSIAAISLATAVIAQAADPAGAHAWIYAAYAGVLLAAGLPTVSRIPDHHGSW